MFWQAGIIDSRETLAPGLIEQPAFPIFIQSYNNLYATWNRQQVVPRSTDETMENTMIKRSNNFICRYLIGN